MSPKPPRFPYPTRHADTREGRLAYFDEGRGDAVVFVHGLAGDFTHFEHVAAALLPDHRVIGVDMPGCGASHRPATRTDLAACTGALTALLDHLGLDAVTLVGHSAGGQICASVAARQPSRVERLVLINSAGFRPYRAATRLLARAALRPWLLRKVLPRTAMKILGHVLHAKNAYTEKFVSDALERPHHPVLTDIARVIHDLTPDLMDATITRDVDRLTMPVLVVWGARDKLVPFDGVAAAVASLPRARLVVIPECGHMPIVEAPAEVAALIRAFATPSAEAA